MLGNNRIFRTFLLCFVVSQIVACSKSFVVESDIPQPLVERIPIKVKLVYSEEFKSYVYIENNKDRALEQVDFGEAQTTTFNQIFDGVVTLVDEGYDLRIEPQILKLEYSAPNETKLKIYEVFLRYRLRVEDKLGNEIADWVVKGYGKTPKRSLSPYLSAFNMASNVALRDVGAQIALGFSEQPAIKAYISQRQSSAKPFHQTVDKAAD